MKSFVLSLALTAGAAMGGDVGGLELADNGLELGDPLADLHISGDVGDLGGLVDN